MVAVTKSSNSEIVMQAYTTACHWFGLSKEESAKMLGVQRTTLNRKKLAGFDTASKEFEIQVLFIKVYRSLYALLGGSQESMKEWMNDYNNHLNEVPKQLCFSLRGIVHVSDYLDAMRGKV